MYINDNIEVSSPLMVSVDIFGKQLSNKNAKKCQAITWLIGKMNTKNSFLSALFKITKNNVGHNKLFYNPKLYTTLWQLNFCDQPAQQIFLKRRQFAYPC